MVLGVGYKVWGVERGVQNAVRLTPYTPRPTVS